MYLLLTTLVGNLTVYPVNKDGSLGVMSQKIQDEGSSINRSRQQGPHVHTAMLSPDEKYLLYTRPQYLIK